MNSGFQSSWKIDKAKQGAETAGIHALKTCGLDLKGKSQDEVPVDLGDLKGDCSVSEPEKSKDNITVTVGYSLPYALRQHEHPEYQHPKAGKAKFLEDPYKNNSGKYEKHIGNEIKKALGE